jgi:hypothetical protein
LHCLLSQDAALRDALGFARVPHRRTVERRMQSLIPEAEAQVAALGRRIAEEVAPAAEQPQTSAIDGRMYAASGPRRHKQQRRDGRIPLGLRNVDTESSWSKSGYRGWVQGYRLVLQGLVFPAPVPFFATWRSNREGEATIVAQALKEHRLPVTSVLLGFSEHSVTSQWVEQEVETALRKERQPSGGTVLFPVRLDDTVFEIGEGWPALIKDTRNIRDFNRWKEHDSYR